MGQSSNLQIFFELIDERFGTNILKFVKANHLSLL